jgi:hypothetical protein
MEQWDSIQHLEAADALDHIMNINGMLIWDRLELFKE